MLNEHIFLDRDNDVRVILKVDGTAIDQTAITKFELAFDDFSFDSVNDSTLFDLTSTTPGEVIIKLSTQIFDEGSYVAKVYVYDATNLNGIFFGFINFIVSNHA